MRKGTEGGFGREAAGELGGAAAGAGEVAGVARRGGAALTAFGAEAMEGLMAEEVEGGMGGSGAGVGQGGGVRGGGCGRRNPRAADAGQLTAVCAEEVAGKIRRAVLTGELEGASALWETYAELIAGEIRGGRCAEARVAQMRELIDWTRGAIGCGLAHAQLRLNACRTKLHAAAIYGQKAL
jgi:hypothetical protein